MGCNTRGATDLDGSAVSDFDAFYRRYADRIYNVVLRIIGDAEEALDALQQAFMRAYRSWNRFREASSRYTWVYRIALNCAYTHLKRMRRLREHAPASLDAAVEKPPAASVSGGADVVREASRREVNVLVQQAILRLPEEIRAPLVLRDIDGLSYNEIAEIIECPVGTVKSRVHRAR